MLLLWVSNREPVAGLNKHKEYNGIAKHLALNRFFFLRDASSVVSYGLL